MNKFSDFHVENIEYIVKRSYGENSEIAISHKTSYRLVYIINGAAEFFFKNHTLETVKGDVLFLSPKNDHVIKTAAGAVFSFVTIAFTADETVFMPAYKHNDSSFEDSFIKAYEYFASGDEGMNFYIKSIIYKTLAALIKASSISEYSDRRIEESVLYIKKNYDKKITLEDLAYKSGYSVSHFKRLFYEQTGTSPIKYLNDFRIEKAKILLKSNMFTISEIAELCGFKNVYYFSNAFKKSSGISPNLYLKAKTV